MRKLSSIIQEDPKSNDKHCCYCSVTESCTTLCYPMDYSPPGSSVHGISQARILAWGTFSRGSSWFRDKTWITCIGRQILYHWVTREPPYKEYTKEIHIEKTRRSLQTATRNWKRIGIDSLLESLKWVKPCQHLNRRLLPSELWQKKFHSF